MLQSAPAIRRRARTRLTMDEEYLEMHGSRWAAGLVAFAISAATWAAAQQGGADALAQLKTKDSLTDADRATINSFLTQAVTAIKGDSPGAAQDAKNKIVAAYEGASKGFREAFAGAAIPLIAQNYKSAGDMGAVQLIALLGVLNVAEANPTLLEALKDPRVGVRGAAAAQLRQLRERLVQAGPGFHGAALNALKEAAKKEVNRGALREIYAAMRYDNVASPPDVKGCAAAFVDVLDARAKAHTSAQVAAFTGDDVAFRALTDMAAQLDDDQKKRVADAVGAIIRVCVTQYTLGDHPLIEAHGVSPQVEERNNAAAEMEEGEALLKAILAPTQPPSLRTGITKGDASKLKEAWKSWAELIKARTGKDYTV